MLNRWRKIGIFGLVVATLGAERGASADDWGQFGLDLGRRRTTPEISGAAFQAQWDHAVKGGRLVSSPAVSDGTLLLAGMDGGVEALRATDGKALWRTDLADELASSPAVDRGRMFIPSLGGKLFALRIADGSLLWKQAFGGHDYGSPVLITDATTGRADTLVLPAGFPAQTVARLSTDKGEPVWETAKGVIGDLMSSSPAIVGGKVIIGMNGGRYQALDLQTGVPLWSFETKGAVNLSAPLVLGGRAYLLPGDKQAQLFAVNADDGKPIDKFPFAIKDPSAPPAGKVLDVSVSTSSPMNVGKFVVAQLRYEYSVTPVGDTSPRSYLREYVVAVDPDTVSVAWTQLVGSKETSNPNDIPELNLCATPAGFAGVSGAGSFVAATSSLTAKIYVLDAKTGAVGWSAPLAGPSRSSPVFANGQLFVATDAGVLHAFGSQVNRAPTAPLKLSPGGGRVVDRIGTVLSWDGATDPESSSLSYQVRVDDDGEVVENWLVDVTTKAGEASAEIPVFLKDGVMYSFSVRSRDAFGAWSAWSAVEHFKAEQVPTVDIAGKTYANISEAVAHAQPGDAIRLGIGAYRLGGTVMVPPGVTISGAGGLLTILDATGLAAGFVIKADPARMGQTIIEGLTVTGGRVGIKVSGGALTTLRNVILRDHDEAGLDVDVGQRAELINGTVLWNGVGARSAGALDVRNSIVIENKSAGLATSGADGKVGSRYNDLLGNGADYLGMVAGDNDFSAPVSFVDPTTRDLRLSGPQLTTDRGDPADPFDLEPMPNGARVNLGAFGNTSLAELSLEAPMPPAVTDGTPGGTSPAGTPPGATAMPVTKSAGMRHWGCTVAQTGSSGAADTGFGLILGLGLVAMTLRARRRR